MLTTLWHILYLMKAQISGKGGTPPLYFTVLTLSADAFCFFCLIFRPDFLF